MSERRSLFRRNQKVKSTVGELLAHPGTDPTKTDEVLGTFFESVFVEQGDEELPEFADRFPKGPIHQPSYIQ